MKTDYTITPEYHLAICQQARLDWLAFYACGLQNSAGREAPKQLERMQCGMMNINPCSGQQTSNSYEAALRDEANKMYAESTRINWDHAYAEARRSHAAGDPLIRTVCKIATRILIVLLLVGIGAGVMLK